MIRIIEKVTISFVMYFHNNHVTVVQDSTVYTQYTCAFEWKFIFVGISFIGFRTSIMINSGKFKINLFFIGGSTYNYITVTIFEVKWVNDFQNKNAVF